MDSLNAKLILDQIHADANEAANKLLSEARDRAATISEHSSQRLQQLAEDIEAQAQAEADVLEDRMRRLDGLELRKQAVAQKRGLMDRVFKDALDQLNWSHSEDIAAVMAGLLTQYAAGDETLKAGAINDAFFTPAFVQGVNESLEKSGKQGKLTAAAERLPDVCGIVLQSANSEMHCTFAALMETRREELEARVADILFHHPTH